MDSTKESGCEKPNVSLKWDQPILELRRGPDQVKLNVPALKVDGADVMKFLRLSIWLGIISFALGCIAIVLVLLSR